MTHGTNGIVLSTDIWYGLLFDATVVENFMRAEINKLVKGELQQATDHLTNTIALLQKSNDDLFTQVRDLNFKIDDLEEYGRRSLGCQKCKTKMLRILSWK